MINGRYGGGFGSRFGSSAVLFFLFIILQRATHSSILSDDFFSRHITHESASNTQKD